MHQDEGCYEYIDESYATTDRATIVSSDTILSADQNDRVHAAATKAMGKMGDDSSALIMSTSSTGVAPADGDADEAPGAPATGQASDDEDESHLLDPSPFLKIFGRLKGQSASAIKRTAPKSNPKTTPAEKKARTSSTTGPGGGGGDKVGRNRKRSSTAEQEDEIPSSEKGGDFIGVKAPVPAGSDDSELISSYQTQLDALQQLDVEGSSDQVFGPWCKSRLAKLAELKAGGPDLSHSLLNMLDVKSTPDSYATHIEPDSVMMNPSFAVRSDYI